MLQCELLYSYTLLYFFYAVWEPTRVDWREVSYGWWRKKDKGVPYRMMSAGSSSVLRRRDKPLKSVTHGQCDATPTVTFPSTGHHRPLTGTKLYCFMRETRVWTACPMMLRESETAYKWNDVVFVLRSLLWKAVNRLPRSFNDKLKFPHLFGFFVFPLLYPWRILRHA